METPALLHLMRAYFHQDFDLEGTPDQIVQAFLDGEPELAVRIETEIDWALAAFPSESAMKRFVSDELDSSYVVDHDGGSYREWLHDVARRAALVQH